VVVRTTCRGADDVPRHSSYDTVMNVTAPAMRVRVGTSGYSYKEWKGGFYPKDISDRGLLRFYAAHLPTVEINNTFYRMPTEKLALDWCAEVPEDFTFAIKAPQRITHLSKLKNTEAAMAALLKAVTPMGPRLGPLLFQLPPFLRKDVPLLEAFLAQCPGEMRVAFEFRHASWFDDDVWTALRRHGAALCVAEGEALVSPLVATADWGYVRLRRDEYTKDVIASWAGKILSQPWREAFVYLKHDDGDAPGVAKQLIAELARST
jgi:uncharacterized protein YecE (DUF72 family)